MSLLDRIFFEMSATDLNALFPEEALYPLYRRFPDSSGSHAHMQEILESAILDGTELDQALSIWEQSCRDDERQGFHNGFRFACMLAQDLAEK